MLSLWFSFNDFKLQNSFGVNAVHRTVVRIQFIQIAQVCHECKYATFSDIIHTNAQYETNGLVKAGCYCKNGNSM